MSIAGFGERFHELYGDVPESFRITEGGIFLATPLDVLAEAMNRVAGLGLIGEGAVVLDAGSGDGRVVLALAIRFASIARARIVGLECDEELVRVAERTVATFDSPIRPRIARGDYHDDRTFGALGISFSDVDVVMHYPDGNEQALFDRIAREGKSGATLLLLSPQISRLIHQEPLQRIAVQPNGAVVAWYLSVYRPRLEV